MEITFNSRKMGKSVTFFSSVDPDEFTTGHLWVDINGQCGTLGVQCFNSNGGAVSVTGQSFKKDCQRIYRQMVAEYEEW